MYWNMLRKGNLKISIIIILLLLSLSSFSPVLPTPKVAAQASQPSCPDSQTLTMALPGGVPNSFNGVNAFTNSGGQTMRMVYLALDPPPSPNGTPYYPDSIISGMSSNSNYTQWTFDLKSGLKWSDGTNVTPRDVINTFSPNFALNATADVQGLHSEITKVQAINNSAVQFILNVTDAHLPEKLSGMLYANVQPASFIAQGAFFTGFGGTYPADGPFIIDNYSSSQTQAVLIPNPNYTPHPSECKVILDYVESESEVSTLLQSGTADLGESVAYGDVANLLKVPTLHLDAEKNLLYTNLFYNVTAYPYNMTQFRQALIYGINESQIDQQAFPSLSRVAYSGEGTIPPNTTWYSSNQKMYSYNQSEALTLLNQIKITKNSQGQLTFPNGTAITLNLWTMNDYSADITTASIVQENLQTLGFTVILNPPTLSTNLISYVYANTHDIDHAMMIHTDGACIFGLAYLDALPLNQVCGPYYFSNTWEYPPSVQAEYKSNLTALDQTANPTLERQYLANIQALNAQYLPVATLNYADDPVIYSTAKWTNWPSTGLLDGYSIEFNNTAIALLQPVSGTSATATSSTSSSNTVLSQTSSLFSSTTAPTSTSSVTSVSSSTSGTIGNSTLLYAAAAVIIIVILGGVGFALRRRPKT